MGCFCLEEIKEPKIPNDASIFNKKELIKDGLDVYEYENLCKNFSNQIYLFAHYAMKYFQKRKYKK